jgi:hypothetical protein
MTEQAYAVIATVAQQVMIQNPANGEPVETTVQPGYVINRVMWDGGSEWSPPAGTEARADPTGTLQIGQTTTV